MRTRTPTPDPETVRRTVGCRICNVPPGDPCMRVRRQERKPLVRARNHQVRVEDAKRSLRG